MRVKEHNREKQKGGGVPYDQLPPDVARQERINDLNAAIRNGAAKVVVRSPEYDSGSKNKGGSRRGHR